MTVPDPREPWQQPTAVAPAHHARRRLPPTGIIVVSILALVVGVTALGFLVLGRPGGAEPDSVGKPVLVVPSVSSEPTVPVIKFSTDPGARGTEPAPTTKVATTRAAPAPKPDKTPKPTRTTTKPKPKPKPVRAGALCSPPGAVGRNSKGALMMCVLAPDGHGRWRRI